MCRSQAGTIHINIYVTFKGTAYFALRVCVLLGNPTHISQLFDVKYKNYQTSLGDMISLLVSYPGILSVVEIFYMMNGNTPNKKYCAK